LFNGSPSIWGFAKKAFDVAGPRANLRIVVLLEEDFANYAEIYALTA